MKITTASIVFSLVAFVQVLRIVYQVRQDRLGIRSGLIWVLMWGGGGIGSLFPSTMDVLMRFAMMENRMFFILIIAVFVLFALVFDLVSRIEKSERNIAKLVQEIALLRFRLDEAKKEGEERS
ncbi:MAG: DUF2304 domain-containing protein [Thermodesulfobacteriota bacterium]